jgi:hypothetical protein
MKTPAAVYDMLPKCNDMRPIEHFYEAKVRDCAEQTRLIVLRITKDERKAARAKTKILKRYDLGKKFGTCANNKPPRHFVMTGPV